MAKSYNQKVKLLYIMQLLLNETDENHPITAEGIIVHLNRHGIAAERKSVYDDIEALKTFGIEIMNSRTKPKGYYVAERSFEIAELKLLVDSVQSSKFITEKKTSTLIHKLSHLASIYEAELIERQIYVKNRIKSMNESIYYNVDSIHDGIASNRKITFNYFDYGVDKKAKLRHDGKLYCVSPYALTWDNENYYLIAYDDEAAKIKHYRVDKMKKIDTADEPRVGREFFRELDMSTYTKHNFAMFSGEDEMVTLELKNSLVGVIIDRFGKDVILIPSGEDRFRVTLSVAVSTQFFGWVFGLGEDVKIVSPSRVADEMKERTKKIGEMY